MVAPPSKNPKSEINDWCIFATQGKQKATYLTEGDNAKPPSHRCTLTLPDGRTFQSEKAHKKKKDAEQDAAAKAMLVIGRSEPEPSIAEPSSDTAAGRWQLVKHRLEAAFADKNVLHFGPLYPFFVEAKLTKRPIPLTAVAQLDNRIATALRGVDPRAEWDPLCGLALLVAAVRECEGVRLSDEGLAVCRTQPWPDDLNRAPSPGWKPLEPSPGSHDCFAAVFLPQDNNRAPVGFSMMKSHGYMDAIAGALRIGSDQTPREYRTHRVLVSRPVAKAGSNLRVYSELPPLPTAHVSIDGSVTFVPAASGQNPSLGADFSERSRSGNPREGEAELNHHGEDEGVGFMSGRNERNATAGTESSERNSPAVPGGTGFPDRTGEGYLYQPHGDAATEGWLSGIPEDDHGTKEFGRAERNTGAPNGRNGRNERASWVAGYAVYGDAVLASAGTTYSSQGRMTWDHFSTKDWHTLLTSRHPRGMYQLSRGAPLAATLPRVYPGSDRWEGRYPKTLLYELLKHKCSGAEGKGPIYMVSEKGGTAGGSAGVKDTEMKEATGFCPPSARCSASGGLVNQDGSRKVVGDEESSEGEADGKRPKLEEPGGANSSAVSTGGDLRSGVSWEVEVGFLFDHRWMKASSRGLWASPGEAENSAALVALHSVQALFDARTLTRDAAIEEACLGNVSKPEHEGMAIVDYTMLYELSADEQEKVGRCNWGVLQSTDAGAVGWAGGLERTNRGALPSGEKGQAIAGLVSENNSRAARPTQPEGEQCSEGKQEVLQLAVPVTISRETGLETNRGLPVSPETGPSAVGIVLEDNRGFLVPRGTGALLPELEACIDTCPQGETRTVRLRPLASWRPILVTTSETSPEMQIVGRENIEESHRKEVTTSRDVIVHLRVCGYVEPREQRLEGALFTPSLAAQRMDFALGVIGRCEAASVLDLGCGSGAFLETVVGRATCVQKLAGVDISERALQKARKAVRARFEKRASENALHDRGKIASPDDVQILSGSMLTLDEQFVGWDLATCIEVVEHLDPGPLADFGPTVLGRLRPRALLVSTPNIEYNPILQAAATGTGASPSKHDNEPAGVSARLRNDDHRFEWTRAEFEAWARGLASGYGYSVDFSGVGGDGAGTEPGYCTQIALFRKD